MISDREQERRSRIVVLSLQVVLPVIGIVVLATFATGAQRTASRDYHLANVAQTHAILDGRASPAGYPTLPKQEQDSIPEFAAVSAKNAASAVLADQTLVARYQADYAEDENQFRWYIGAAVVLFLVVCRAVREVMMLPTQKGQSIGDKDSGQPDLPTGDSGFVARVMYRRKPGYARWRRMHQSSRHKIKPASQFLLPEPGSTDELGLVSVP